MIKIQCVTLYASRYTLIFVAIPFFSIAQLKWTKVDSLYQPLPPSVHVYTTTEKIDTGSFRAFYVVADLKDKKLDFTVDTTLNRRLTPTKFYEKNSQPLVVVNCAFFSFETNHSLNLVVKNRQVLETNVQSLPLKGRDTLKFFHTTPSAIGISKKRVADVAWTIMGNSLNNVNETRFPVWWIDSSQNFSSDSFILKSKTNAGPKKWKIRTAVGGGPVLLNNNEINITNDEERKFTGKAINDKHPRTAMGYTKDHKLIILVVQGRSESSGGATLSQEAQILKDLGCVEALNLDGGGSSCMLVNGNETIKPSDATGQRPVPAVFIIKRK